MHSLFHRTRSLPRRPRAAGGRRVSVEALECRLLLSAGDLDTTFNTSGKAEIYFDLGGSNGDDGRAVAIQPDGKIVVVGAVERDSSNYDFGISRLNPDGSPDTTFSGDGEATVSFDAGGSRSDRATGVAIQPDGKIVVVGVVEEPTSG